MASAAASTSTASDDPDPARFAAAATRVAVAQICHSVGLRRAEPAALRSLTDLAGRYIQAVARHASASANSQGRTNCNLLDVVLAIEDMTSPRGFVGAGDPKIPLLRSLVLSEIIEFVDSVDEEPFATSLRLRSGLPVPTRDRNPSFVQAGKEPPPHVPRWLPVFPVLPQRLEGRGEARKRDESLWPCNEGRMLESFVGTRGEGGKEVFDLEMTVLPVLRERVRFGFGSVSRKDSRGPGEHWTSVEEVGRGLVKRKESEEDDFISFASKLQRCQFGVCPRMAIDISSSLAD